VNLPAACRIKSCAVEHDRRPAIAVERFDYAGVKVIKKRIVIVKAISSHDFNKGQKLAANSRE
jgi:hypothetical protein